MLKMSKEVTMNATSEVNGKVAATMYANLSNGSTTISVADDALYAQYKKEVRKDIGYFQEKVYEEQDAEGVTNNENE